MYIVICEDNGDEIVQCADNGEIEWYPLKEIKEHNPVLYDYDKAARFCKSANVGIYALTQGHHYFIKEYDNEEL